MSLPLPSGTHNCIQMPLDDLAVCVATSIGVLLWRVNCTVSPIAPVCILYQELTNNATRETLV